MCPASAWGCSWGGVTREPQNLERKGGREPEGPWAESGRWRLQKTTPGPQVLGEATAQPPPFTMAEKTSRMPRLTAVPGRKGAELVCPCLGGRTKGRVWPHPSPSGKVGLS